jgi:hypothetical protein
MYASMVLMCVLTSILLLLGYLAFYYSMLAFLFEGFRHPAAAPLSLHSIMGVIPKAPVGSLLILRSY